MVDIVTQNNPPEKSGCINSLILSLNPTELLEILGLEQDENWRAPVLMPAGCLLCVSPVLLSPKWKRQSARSVITSDHDTQG